MVCHIVLGHYYLECSWLPQKFTLKSNTSDHRTYCGQQAQKLKGHWAPVSKPLEREKKWRKLHLLKLQEKEKILGILTSVSYSRKLYQSGICKWKFTLDIYYIVCLSPVIASLCWFRTRQFSPAAEHLCI